MSYLLESECWPSSGDQLLDTAGQLLARSVGLLQPKSGHLQQRSDFAELIVVVIVVAK